MKVSGFSICRNGVKFDFPVVESIQSVLPVVDEYVVNVGQSDDGTLDLIRSIHSNKIKIVESWWDDSMTKDGLLFSKETNVALSHCTGQWALYVQADEVLHERDYEQIQRVLRDEIANPQVLGFTFRYLHFYGDYWTVNPWAYHRAVRIIRNNGQIVSCGDAVGFCLEEDGGYLQSRHRDRVRPSGSTIYHYGWVKPGKVLLDKFRYQIPRYHGDNPPADQASRLRQETFDFPEYGIMKRFRGEHPAVMSDRVSAFPRLWPGRNRWFNPRFYLTVLRRGFRG